MGAVKCNRIEKQEFLLFGLFSVTSHTGGSLLLNFPKDPFAFIHVSYVRNNYIIGLSSTTNEKAGYVNVRLYSMLNEVKTISITKRAWIDQKSNTITPAQLC